MYLHLYYTLLPDVSAVSLQVHHNCGCTFRLVSLFSAVDGIAVALSSEGFVENPLHFLIQSQGLHTNLSSVVAAFTGDFANVCAHVVSLCRSLRTVLPLVGSLDF